ncbi:MAG: ABC transporter substrate-binding protein [Elainellaceae cyanobacterium]
MSAANVPYPDTRPTEGYEGMRFVGIQIYDALTAFNLDQGEKVPTPQPALAESWEVSEDGLTWTFQLKQGVKFHDGTDFNAEAAVFAFDRVTNKDFEFFSPEMYAANRANTSFIASYRAIDNYTLEITTDRPYAFLPWDLTHILIPSPTAVKQHGNAEFKNHAIGTGPFKMVNYVDGQVLELEANPDYWGTPPKLNKLVLRPFGEPASRLAALQAGDIDWAEVPPPDALDQLRAQGYNVQLKEYPHTIVLALNLYNPPFDNVKVRQALQYAVDRESMCQKLLNGVCDPALQYLYRGHEWYNTTFAERYQYDPEKAKQLLAEAGYASGLKIRVAYPTGGSGNMWPGPMMELLQANLKDVGVDLELVPLEWNNVISMFRQGFGAPENQQYNAYYISLAPMTPSSLAYFTTGRIPPNGCCNSTGYSSTKADELYAAAEAEFDQAKQDALLQEYMGVVAEDAPFLFMVHDLNLRVLAPEVSGFVQPKSWWADLKTVWVEE